MKQIFIWVIIALCATFTGKAANNIAYQDANVRFTVISDGTVRGDKNNDKADAQWILDQINYKK